MNTMIRLRQVEEADLEVLFKQEQDPEANRMATYPVKGKEIFLLQWRQKLLDKKASVLNTILWNEEVAGSIECWEQGEKWYIGYWLGREYWGRGIETQAVQEFLSQLKTRPLYAHVPNHNEASIRVLEKTVSNSDRSKLFSAPPPRPRNRRKKFFIVR